MESIEGQKCVRCARAIQGRAEGGFCSRCGQPIHHHCRPANSNLVDENHCEECGSEFAHQDWDAIATQFDVDENDSAMERAISFYSTLVQLTPRIYVTPTLVAINVIVFVLMVINGVSPISPTIPDLLGWGANFGPLTLGGQSWRLFTAMFLHIGILHIALNMWVLWTAGPLVERMLGNVGFLLLYLFAGLGGSLASVWWNPMIVSAGASGAIFGIYGALLALLIRQHGAIPSEPLAHLRSSGLTFVGYNLFYGLTQPRIDNAAHIGGLLAGFVGGLILRQQFGIAAKSGRLVRNLGLALVGSLLVGGGMWGVSQQHRNVQQVSEELDRFEKVEQKSVDAVNVAVTNEWPNERFADLLEKEVLPPWKAQHQRLKDLKDIPPQLQERVRLLLDYVALREQAWELIVQAIREDDNDKLEQAQQKQKECEAAIERLRENNADE